MLQIDKTDEDEAFRHTDHHQNTHSVGNMAAVPVALLVKIITSPFPLIHRPRWERLLYPSCSASGSGSAGEHEARRLRATIVLSLYL